jgi:hypothetical protein
MLAFIACQNGPPTRTVSGQLRAGAFALDNAVVIAQSSDQRMFVRHVDARGQFQLALPPNASYRLTLANTTRSGAYHALTRIQWPTPSGPAVWAKLSMGGTLFLGTVKPKSYGGACGHYEWDDDDDEQCREMDDDEHADGGDRHYGQHDDDGDCEDDKAVECEADDEGDSECDDHDDGDHAQSTSHDHDGCDQDDDDHHDAEHDQQSKCHCMQQNPPPSFTPPDAGAQPPSFTPPGTGTQGSPCMVNADCTTGLQCINSTCALPLL